MIRKLTPILVTILLMFVSANSQGCTCSDTTIEEDYESHAVVFVGTVIKAEVTNTISEGNFMLSAKFSLSKILKGSPDPDYEYSYSNSSAMCGVEMIVGAQYLIFSSGGSLNGCSASGILNRGNDAFSKARREWVETFEAD